MGGEGSMASAILTLKQNRALLKKRKFKDMKALLLEGAKKTEMEFKQVSPQEMFRIKQKIRQQSKKDKQREIIIYTVSTLVVFGIFYFLYSIIEI